MPEINSHFEIPEKVRKQFNWGAFFLGWIWGIFNKAPITLIQIPLNFVPAAGRYLSLICAVWFGFTGNRTALKNKKFESLEEFQTYQRKFVKAGITVMILSAFAIILIITAARPALLYQAQGAAARFEQLGLEKLFIFACISFEMLLYGAVIIYFLKIKKIAKMFYALLLVIISGTIIINPYLEYKFRVNLNRRVYKDTAEIALMLATLTFSKDKKDYYYYTMGNCYIELKDTDSAIKAFEKSKISDKEILADLYILKNNYDKAIEHGGKYKVCALEDDWKCTVESLDEKIKNTEAKILSDETEYANNYRLYLARAVAYKHLGEYKHSLSDYETALKIAPSDRIEEIKAAYGNKNYFKDFYANIREILEVK